jgi:NAD+ kinase
MKHIGVLYHPKREAAVTFAGELHKFLTARGLSVWQCSTWEEDKVRKQAPGCDLIISVGGDGTLLRAARAITPATAPILGINLGKLGFLTELSAAEAMGKLPLILEGQGWQESRAMLEAEISVPGKGGKYHALNDVVMARGASARLINIEVRLDGKFLTTYRADGLIICTATGSTGYCLASGGPILHPETKDIVLKPIAPHFSIDQALVLPSDTLVHLKVNTGHEAMVSIDGQVEVPLKDGDEIKAQISPYCAMLWRLRPRSYFYNSLEQVFKGKML